MADEDRAFRVMSYNLDLRHTDPGALAAVVRDLAPDILIAQEAPRRLRWRTRSADLAHRFGMVYAAGGLPSLGNLVLTTYRVRVHDTWCVQFPLTPGRHMRGAVFARCSIGSAQFVVVGTHLGTDAGERPDQAAVLRKVMGEVDVPLALAGDFNETAGGSAWRTLADSMVDAAEAAGGAGAPTYPALAPTARLDAIFVGPGLTVRDCRVVDSAQARAASDHLPVVADLVLTG